MHLLGDVRRRVVDDDPLRPVASAMPSRSSAAMPASADDEERVVDAEVDEARAGDLGRRHPGQVGRGEDRLGDFTRVAAELLRERQRPVGLCVGAVGRPHHRIDVGSAGDLRERGCQPVGEQGEKVGHGQTIVAARAAGSVGGFRLRRSPTRSRPTGRTPSRVRRERRSRCSPNESSMPLPRLSVASGSTTAAGASNVSSPSSAPKSIGAAVASSAAAGSIAVSNPDSPADGLDSSNVASNPLISNDWPARGVGEHLLAESIAACGHGGACLGLIISRDRGLVVTQLRSRHRPSPALRQPTPTESSSVGSVIDEASSDPGGSGPGSASMPGVVSGRSGITTRMTSRSTSIPGPA